MVDRSPIEAPDPALAEVVWIHDPSLDDLHTPMTCRPSELLGVIDDVLTEAGIADVVVTGTSKGLRRRPRWWGFDLVETAPTGESPAATLRCVVFARHMASIEAALAASDTTIVDGAEATVTGTLGVNAPWGELRVVASAIAIRNERSAETTAREQLINHLVTSGEATAQQRLTLLPRPHRIAILAGADTAGAADLDNLFAASNHNWQLLHHAVPMAGARAADAVATGIAILAERRPDVIVVARGGGAPGEMARADTPQVARAITGCAVPVWTAIGHATDRTVADVVANRACATPSAAAAALISMVDEDTHRRRAAAASAAHVAALAHATSRARIAWLTAALAVVALIAVLVAARGR